jgi:hypothetical protein
MRTKDFMGWAALGALALIAAISHCSCLHRGDKIEYEQGVVIGRQMEPGYYHSYTTYEEVYYGRAYKGRRQSVSIPVNHKVYIPPTYTVTFKCQHQDVFKIHREDVYNSLNQFDTVTIEFYNLLNGREQIKAYDFITAYKQKR